MNIHIPLTAATLAGFAATLAHASRDKVTPILTGIHITPSHVIATDRYSVGRFMHTAPDADAPTPADAVTLTREAADWIVGYKLDRYAPELVLTIDSDADALTITDTAGNVRATLAGVTLAGNFPPVARLYPERSDDTRDVSPFHLGADKLAAVAKTGQILGRADKLKNAPIRFQLAAGDGYKSGPVLFSIGETFDGLLQPVITRH